MCNKVLNKDEVNLFQNREKKNVIRKTVKDQLVKIDWIEEDRLVW